MASDNPTVKAMTRQLLAAARKAEQELERRDAEERTKIAACADPALKADLIRQRDERIEAEREAWSDTSAAMCSLQISAHLGAAMARQAMRRT
jgi:hypothetical protein